MTRTSPQGRSRGWSTGFGVLGRAVVAWAVLIAFVVGLTVLRSRASEIKQVPLRDVPRVHLSAEQRASWRSIPDYTDAIPVVLYHSIGAHLPPNVASYLNESRKDFARQMLALKVGGFHPVSLRTFARWYQAWRDGKTVPLPAKPILITFDDGRADAYIAANAILDRYHFHAVDLVVPGWVTSHPGFSLHWATLQKMEAGGTWTIQEHFGYGAEGVPVNAKGTLSGRFGDLRYIQGGGDGHLESFRQFMASLAHNMTWGERQIRKQVPGYKKVAMAIPRSDYGQSGSNDPRIARASLGWLDRHYPIVFMGDYLYGGSHGSDAIVRVTKQLVYRMTMTDQLSLAGLRCRLSDYAQHTPIWMEYRCERLRT